MAQLLVGIRVLDLTRFYPGPFCTQILADLGAEVTKIEAPPEGDPSRAGPTRIGRFGSTFVMLNRSKKSVMLNLKDKAGVEVFRRLSGKADVVIENFRPGVTEKLGIGYNQLRRDNRKLIYCSLTGYGQDGPYSGRAGHDINFVGYSGVGSVTGLRGGPVVPLGIQAADIAGGALMAAFAVMAALYHREKTGRGQYIDVSMLDGLVAVGQTLFGELQAQGASPAPGEGELNGGYPVYGVYETKDGKYFSIGGLEEKFWQNFCLKAGRMDLMEIHWSGMGKDRDRLEKELKKIFKTKTRDEWTQLLAGAEACASPVLTIEEAMNDEHLNSRGMFVEGPSPDGEPVKQVAMPIKFSDIEPDGPRAAPKLGEHTDEILQSVGYNKKEIERLRKDRVI